MQGRHFELPGRPSATSAHRCNALAAGRLTAAAAAGQLRGQLTKYSHTCRQRGKPCLSPQLLLSAVPLGRRLLGAQLAALPVVLVGRSRKQGMKELNQRVVGKGARVKEGPCGTAVSARTSWRPAGASCTRPYHTH